MNAIGLVGTQRKIGSILQQNIQVLFFVVVVVVVELVEARLTFSCYPDACTKIVHHLNNITPEVSTISEGSKDEEEETTTVVLKPPEIPLAFSTPSFPITPQPINVEKAARTTGEARTQRLIEMSPQHQRILETMTEEDKIIMMEALQSSN